MEGDFHPANPKLNLVGDYSKCVEAGDLDSMILYEIVHEKEQMRHAMFMHMMEPFWAGYNTELTNLEGAEKFLIFLKILREVRHVYDIDTLAEIVNAMQLRLDVSDEKGNLLVNGKMWHDYFMNGYESYAMSKMSSDSLGFYM